MKDKQEEANMRKQENMNASKQESNWSHHCCYPLTNDNSVQVLAQIKDV